MQDWTTGAEFDEFASGGGTGFVFKHSTRCSVSSEAQREVERFLAEQPDAPVYRVLVVESRAASQHIARSAGVTHASPQVILLDDGQVAWHGSHWDITAKALLSAWETARTA